VQALLTRRSNKYYSFRVCVCSRNYPACNAHAPNCHLWPALLPCFSTLSHKRHDFRRNILLIPQPFDWLAAFHLDLSQGSMFIAVQLSAPVFLATCLKFCSRGLPTNLFSKYCSLQDVYYKLVMPNCMLYP